MNVRRIIAVLFAAILMAFLVNTGWASFTQYNPRHGKNTADYYFSAWDPLLNGGKGAFADDESDYADVDSFMDEVSRYDTPMIVYTWDCWED